MPPRLLLVDERVTIQRAVELTCAAEGIDVIVAASSAEAIARAGSERPDIVLADVGTPEPDGCAVAAFIKGHPDLAGIPVVLLTRALEPLDEERMRQARCDGVLVAPFEPPAVISTVTGLLSKSREDRSSRDERAAQQGTETASGGARASDRPPLATAGVPSGRDPLDAYFDRLDAAFASLRMGGASMPRPAAEDVARLAPGERDGPGSSPSHTDPLAGRLAHPQAWVGLRWPAPVSGASTGSLPPEPADGPARLPSPPRATAGPIIPDAVIDEIARRVVERLDNEGMRRLVLETAERMVRAEIDRIKGTSGAAPTRSTG